MEMPTEIDFDQATTYLINLRRCCSCPEMECNPPGFEWDPRDTVRCTGGWGPYPKTEGDPDGFDFGVDGALIPWYQRKVTSTQSVVSYNSGVASTRYDDGDVIDSHTFAEVIAIDETISKTTRFDFARTDFPASNIPADICANLTVVQEDAPTPSITLDVEPADGHTAPDGYVLCKATWPDARPVYIDPAGEKFGGYGAYMDDAGPIVWEMIGTTPTCYFLLEETDNCPTCCHVFQVLGGKWGPRVKFSLADSSCCEEGTDKECPRANEGFSQSTNPGRDSHAITIDGDSYDPRCDAAPDDSAHDGATNSADCGSEVVTVVETTTPSEVKLVTTFKFLRDLPAMTSVGLTGAKVNGVAATSIDIIAATITGAEATGGSLTGASMSAGVYSGGSLNGTPLAMGQTITIADLHSADLSSADLDSTSVTAGGLSNGTITGGAVGDGNVATGGLGSGTLVSGTLSGGGGLVSGTLSGGTLTGGTLTGGTLTGGTLVTGTLTGGTLTGGTLTGGTLAFGDLVTGTLSDSTLTGGTLTGGSLTTGTLTGGTLESGTLTGGGITGGGLTGGSLSGGGLSGSKTDGDGETLANDEDVESGFTGWRVNSSNCSKLIVITETNKFFDDCNTGDFSALLAEAFAVTAAYATDWGWGITSVGEYLTWPTRDGDSYSPPARFSWVTGCVPAVDYDLDANGDLTGFRNHNKFEVRIRDVRYRWVRESLYRGGTTVYPATGGSGDEYTVYWDVLFVSLAWMRWLPAYYYRSITLWLWEHRTREFTLEPGDPMFPDRDDYASDEDYEAALAAIRTPGYPVRDGFDTDAEYEAALDGLPKDPDVFPPPPWAPHATIPKRYERDYDGFTSLKTEAELRGMYSLYPDPGTAPAAPTVISSHTWLWEAGAAAVPADAPSVCDPTHAERQPPPEPPADVGDDNDHALWELDEEIRTTHAAQTSGWYYLKPTTYPEVDGGRSVGNVRYVCDSNHPSGPIINYDSRFYLTTLPELDPASPIDPTYYSEWFLY